MQVAVFTMPIEVRGDEQKITRVVLADDHAVVRAGIRHLLKKAADIHVVGEAGNGIEALHLVDTLRPDVLLLDMEMPTVNGIEVAQRMQKAGSPVRILVLSAYEDKEYILELLENGASGYLTKDEVPEVIVDAVRGVSRGEEGWVSPRIAAQMTRWRGPAASRLHELNAIELKVLEQLFRRKTDAEIAEILGIQRTTVLRHVHTICVKLGVASRAGAVRAARDAGLWALE